MSLKVMHIIFLLASITLAALFGAWCLNAWRETDSAGYLTALLMTAGSGAGLLVYSAYILNKFRTV